MTKNELKTLRMNILGGMNAHVLATIEDEDILDFWYTYGLPDGVTEDMLEKYAENEDLWLEAVHAFADVLRMD